MTDRNGPVATIVELHYYPVKGCAGISVRDAVLTPAGLAHDRSFLVTDQGGRFRSQRRDPALALIRPVIDGTRLTLRAPGRDPITVDVDTSGPRRGVVLFGNPYTGIDQGDEVAGWLSRFLGVPCRLMRVPPEHARVSTGRIPGTSGYADSCAIHLVSRSALAALNARITERGASPLPMDRFRANIVVDGWDEPHVEDRAHRITIGDTELGYAKLAVRCVVTMVDQAAGVKAGPEPIRTLADYRRAEEGGVAFGTKLVVLRPGALSVGDPVVVRAWGDSEL
jgi:uncharacterized protein YcbX